MKTLCAGLVLGLTTVAAIGARPADRQPTQPFYLEQTESPVDGPSRSFVLARRADGATVRIESKSDKDPIAVRDLFFADGRVVSVFDRLKLKTTWPPNTKRQGVEAEPSRDCNVEQLDDLGQPTDPTIGLDSVQGEVVVVTETKLSDYRITSWRSPRLGCEELYYRSERIESGGSKKLVVEMTTTRLMLGDPDPQLFTINAAFPEAAPSESLIRRVGDNGLPLSDDERERLVHHKSKP